MIRMYGTDFVKRMRRALHAEAALKEAVPVEVEVKHRSAQDEWVADWGTGDVLYHVGLLVEVKPGTKPCNEVWSFVARPSPSQGGGDTVMLTWRGCVNRIELMRRLRQEIPGICVHEVVARIVGLCSVVHPYDAEPGFSVSGSRPTSPAE